MSRANPATDRFPPGQRPAKGWPVLQYGPVPTFDPTTWDFKVWGAVRNPVRFDYRQIRTLDAVEVVADFHCVTKFSVLDIKWTGVSFKTITELVSPRPGARHVMAHCEYGYEVNLPLDCLMDDDVILAWSRDGEDLSAEHGYPLRLVVPKRYAWKSAKWVRGLEFMTEDRRGFWEERGYHNNADPLSEQRYSYQEDESAGSFFRPFGG